MVLAGESWRGLLIFAFVKGKRKALSLCLFIAWSSILSVLGVMHRHPLSIFLLVIRPSAVSLSSTWLAASRLECDDDFVRNAPGSADSIVLFWR